MNEIRKKSIHFLEALDIFSYPLSFLFTFKGKFRYSTVLTKTLTLISFSLTFASFFYFARNSLSKTNPKILITEEYHADPDKVQMDPNSFMFSFALENHTNNYRPFIDAGIYKVEAFLVTKINQIINQTKIDVIPCDEIHLPSNSDLREYFNKSDYKNLYCFKDYSKVFKKGACDSDEFFDIKITIRACDNETDGNICKSQTEITNMIEGGNVVMYYTTVRTDVGSYDAPLKIIALNDFLDTSLEFTTIYHLFLGKVVIKTDIGVFQESFTYDEGTYIVSSKTSQHKTRNIADGFLTIRLRLDPNENLITRKYDSFLDVLSQVGGIMRMFTIFGALLLKPFLEAALLQRVSNETFDYEDYLNDENMSDNSKNLSSSRKKVKLSLWEYIKSKCKKKSKLSRKSQLIIKSVEMMKENLDMSLLVNKLFDIEKLKLMVKNTEFEVLKNQKPKIILNDKKFRKTLFKTEIEKAFHKNFVIGTDSQALRKVFSNTFPETNINPSLKELPGPSSFKNENKDKNIEEHKKEEKQKEEEILIELTNEHKIKKNNSELNEFGDTIEKSNLELKESGNFKGFLSPKISEENLEREINFSKMPDLLRKKKFVEEI